MDCHHHVINRFPACLLADNVHVWRKILPGDTGLADNGIQGGRHGIVCVRRANNHHGTNAEMGIHPECLGVRALCRAELFINTKVWNNRFGFSDDCNRDVHGVFRECFHPVLP